jgi:hypothetical protein
MNQLSKEKQVAVIGGLPEGNSTRSIERRKGRTMTPTKYQPLSSVWESSAVRRPGRESN